MAFPIFEEFINTQTIKDLLSEREDSIVVDAEVRPHFFFLTLK